MRSDSIAIRGLDDSFLTYRQLHLASLQIHDSFKQWGISQRAIVALVLPNGPLMASAFLTVSCAAAVAPINPSFKEREFAFCFEELRP
ncbi:MAG: AMP-binding protein, partial [Phycisphaerae bacterium]|nr:AMP-binding protein [Phycisphaerae bacterium]NIX30239.1 AMP-binding protein [Phycisphaerae bacterium]